MLFSVGVELKLHSAEYKAAIQQAIKSSSRSAEKNINGHAYYVAAKAALETERADRQRIAWQLGQTATQFKILKRGKNKGKTRRTGISIAEDSLAARIVNARIRDKIGNDYQLWGNALEAAAKKLIAARVASVGFVASGWLWAKKKFARYRSSRADQFDSLRTKGAPKGDGIPARPKASGNYSATLINSALITKGSNHNVRVASVGMEKAMAAEIAEMKRHLAEKIVKDVERKV